MEPQWDKHWRPLGTCRGFGGMCEGCGKHARHTETLKNVQRDRWDTGEVHVGAQETPGHVVGHMGAWQDMQENMERQEWEDSRTHVEK